MFYDVIGRKYTMPTLKCMCTLDDAAEVQDGTCPGEPSKQRNRCDSEQSRQHERQGIRKGRTSVMGRMVRTKKATDRVREYG